MNILLVNTLYAPYQVGGAEKSVQLLAEALVDNGHNVSVLTLSYSKSFRKINQVDVYTLKLSNIYWPFSELKNSILAKPFWHLLDVYNPLMNNEIRDVLEVTKPDIVHVNNVLGFSPGIWGLIKSKDIRIIHTLRDYYLLCPYTTMVKNGLPCKQQCSECSLYSYGKKPQSNNVDAVVGVSNFILNKHIDYGFFPKVKLKRVIGNPVRCVSNLESDSVTNKNGKTIFGYIGRLEKAKGVELLLDALRNLEKENYELKIAGCGKTEYVKNLKKEFNSDKVHFLGFVDSNEFYKEIDYLIVPSIYKEPFGRVVVEANGFGVPVVGARSGGIEELIKTGVNGFLFDPANPIELGSILAELIDDGVNIDREMIISSAKDFEATKISFLYEDLYREAIGKNEF